MSQYSHKRIIKISIVISLIAAVIVFVLAMKVLKYAYTENPEYAKWDSLSIKEKNLTTADGKPVYPEPDKQRPLTKNEILILSGGIAFLTPLSVFPINYILFRRKWKGKLD